MEKREIIAKWANDRVVERLIETHADFASNPYIDDLAQDIYISLLKCDDAVIGALSENGEFEHYIKRIINNNLYSKTSPFYYKYNRYRKITDNIDDFQNDN